MSLGAPDQFIIKHRELRGLVNLPSFFHDSCQCREGCSGCTDDTGKSTGLLGALEGR